MPRPVESAHRGDGRGKSYSELCHRATAWEMGQLSAWVPGLRRSPVPQQPFRFHTPGKAGESRYLDLLLPPRQLPSGPMNAPHLQHAGYSLLPWRESFASASGSIESLYLGYGTRSREDGPILRALLRSYPQAAVEARNRTVT
ncbi:hypothetical protein BO94DRAFT_61845 [Aspergillus sclerotioniger CBS 115572]|uniref:Uncharacterized protein n=1 Tax=Aspergillus sclerotioniger CBS 115572 TaxID=1450535 RepID=A0A317WNT6_9EURO|nr:hypothetical protein BO94DRAFT_61845 [Aspergillus sclerotioniger CBS 115572]PWY88043.1 hypothetical protein BO94DRAFT_61845 [Aspergillus sclerotioniger CBS 115572]